jgi:hypothetical protein
MIAVLIFFLRQCVCICNSSALASLNKIKSSIPTFTQMAGVAPVPGDAFGAPACLRISYAASMATLEEALNRIEAALAPGRFTRPGP